MKNLLLITAIFFAVINLKAQESMFIKGDKLVNLGIGLGYYNVAQASLDYCISEGVAEKGSIGVGPYIGFGFNKYYSTILAGIRGTFHYPVIEKLDTYVGLGIGARYRTWKSSYWGYTSTNTNVGYGFFIGANYPVSEKLTVFGEAGYGDSYLNVGVALKL